jgi:hypothetical protein
MWPTPPAVVTARPRRVQSEGDTHLEHARRDRRAAAAGLYLFVPVFPAVFAPMALGRIAIGTWMLLYAGIGLAMLRMTADPRRVTGPRLAARG